MHKNCKKLPAKIHKWNIECIYLCFFPIPYNIAPIVYIIPPDTKSINPFIVSNCGNKGAFTIIHHPIIK